MGSSRWAQKARRLLGVAEPRLEISLKEFRGLMEGFSFRLQEDDEGTPYVPGKHGEIEWHSWDNETVAIYSNKSIAKGRLIRHPKCRIWQRGDDEVRVLVRRADILEVAKIIRPYRKRKISAERREKLLEHLQ